MAERYITIVWIFAPSSPRITVYDIHEWIHASLRTPEQTVKMIQIDGTERQVYIKFVDKGCVLAILCDTRGQAEYKYPTGEFSIVSLAEAGMGTKCIRIANLQPEVPNDTLKVTLALYGKVLDSQAEVWSKAYRY